MLLDDLMSRRVCLLRLSCSSTTASCSSTAASVASRTASVVSSDAPSQPPLLLDTGSGSDSGSGSGCLGAGEDSAAEAVVRCLDLLCARVALLGALPLPFLRLPLSWRGGVVGGAGGWRAGGRNRRSPVGFAAAPPPPLLELLRDKREDAGDDSETAGAAGPSVLLLSPCRGVCC